MSEISDKIRKEFGEKDDERDAGLVIPEDVERFCDIAYGKDPAWQVLDVYRPKSESQKTLPVIVSVHGGGWVYGDKERYQYYCMDLARRGFAVVNFTYRLAPEHKYPASLEDTNLVMGWCQKNAGQYGLDMDNLFAVGDSAGAHILCLYACVLTNPDYAKNYAFRTPEGLRLKAIALNCGQYHIELVSTDEQTRELMKDVLPDGGTSEEQRLVSPDLFIESDFPPTFFMTAPRDFLLPQAQVLQLALLKAQVNFTYRFYCDLHSSLGHVFHLNIRSDWAKKCNDEECDFFRKFYNGEV